MELNSRKHGVKLNKLLVILLSIAIVVTGIPFTQMEVNAANTGASLPGVGGTLLNNYTYIVEKSTTLKSNTAGQSALSVAANSTTTIYIGPDVVLTVEGGAGSNRTGGGAGISIPSSSTLIVTGEGKLIAKGGKGGDAGNGVAGGAPGPVGSNPTNFDTFMKTELKTGAGGSGGNGAGSPGAGIGGEGRIGGSGGAGGDSIRNLYYTDSVNTRYGLHGTDGGSGSVGNSMGRMFLVGNVQVTATAGTAGTSAGSGGAATNRNIIYGIDLSDLNLSVGGGGGGGGVSGTTANIGGSAGSGAGGGGGASGTYNRYTDRRVFPGGAGGGGAGYGMSGTISKTTNVYFVVKMSLDKVTSEYTYTTDDQKNGSNIDGGKGSSSKDNASAGFKILAGSNGGNRQNGGSGGTVYLDTNARVNSISGGSGSVDGKGATTSKDMSSLPDNVKCTITLDKQKGIAGTSSVNAIVGKALSGIGLPTRPGYNFGGYYSQKSGEGTKVYDEYGNIIANATSYTDKKKNWIYPNSTTLYAKWIPEEYEAKFIKTDGVGGDDSAKILYETSFEKKITPPTRPQSLFTGYFSAREGGKQFFDALGNPTTEIWTKRGNDFLYAQWEATPYPVTGQNGSFEYPPFGEYTKDIKFNEKNYAKDFFWRTTASDMMVELVRPKNNKPVAMSTYGMGAASEGDAFAELNGKKVGALYQYLSTQPGGELNYSFDHAGRYGDDTMQLWVGSSDEMFEAFQQYADKGNSISGVEPDLLKKIQQTPDGTSGPDITDSKGKWGSYKGKYKIPAGQKSTVFAFISVKTAGGDKTKGNLLDNVFFLNHEVEPTKTATLEVAGSKGGAVEVSRNGIPKDSATSDSPVSLKVDYGDDIKLTPKAEDGYKYTGAIVNGVYKKPSEVTTSWKVGSDGHRVDYDIVFIFSKSSTVTFIKDGGVYDIDEFTMEASGPNSKYAVKNPTKERHIFKGWQILGSDKSLQADDEIRYMTDSKLNSLVAYKAGENPGDEPSEIHRSVAEDGMVLMADFEKVILAPTLLSFDSNGGEYYTEGFYLDETDPKFILGEAEYRGNAFRGWKYDNKIYNGDTVIEYSIVNNKPMISIDGGAKIENPGSMQFKAQWDLADYAINYVLDGGTINDTDYITEYTFTIGGKLPVDVTKVGYKFAGWYDNSQFTGSEKTEISRDDVGEKEFFAKWVVCDHKDSTNKPTCLDDATCSVCGDDMYATGHKFENYEEQGNQTCTKAGIKIADCENDGCTVTDTKESTNSLLDHTYGSYTSLNDPSCTEPGRKLAKCDACGHEKLQEDTSPSALGHDWGEAVTVSGITCNDDDYMERECSRCKLKEAVGTIGGDHDFSGDFEIDKEPDCQHEGSKSKHCQNDGCQATSEQEIIARLDHVFDFDKEHGTYTTDPTCEADGFASIKCENCDVSIKQYIPGSALGHKFDKDNWTTDNGGHWHAATCGHDLIDDYSPHKYNEIKSCLDSIKCDHCNYLKKEGEKSHKFDGGWQSDGDNHWKVCSNNHCEVKDHEGAHSGEDDGDCTTAVNCDVCKRILTPADSHDYDKSKWEIDLEAHWYQCQNTGCESKTNYSFHDSYDDNDCSTPVICSHCNTEVLPAHSEHNFSHGINKYDFELHWSQCSNTGCLAKDGIDGHAEEPHHGDCTVDRLCNDCEYTVISGRPAHEFVSEFTHDEDTHWNVCDDPECLILGHQAAHINKDDGDCTTAVYCSTCSRLTIEAHDSHDFTNGQLRSDSKYHWIECIHDDCIVGDNKQPHQPEQDDGNCKTEVKCTDCGEVVVKAFDDHSFKGAKWKKEGKKLSMTCVHDNCEHKQYKNVTSKDSKDTDNKNKKSNKTNAEKYTDDKNGVAIGSNGSSGNGSNGGNDGNGGGVNGNNTGSGSGYNYGKGSVNDFGKGSDGVFSSWGSFFKSDLFFYGLIGLLLTAAFLFFIILFKKRDEEEEEVEHAEI